MQSRQSSPVARTGAPRFRARPNTRVSSVLELAVSVISQTGRRRPADQVLRETLKRSRELDAREAAQVARAVFSYYRWRGWLEEGSLLIQQVEHAITLADRFARQPETFQDAELAARAVPDWTRQEMDIDPAWVRSLQAEPKLWLRSRKGQGRGVAEKLGHCRVFGPGMLEDTLEYQGATDLFQSPAFQSGEFEVQDLSSQAVGFLCAPQPGETWWDACAGEGGKTLHLSDLMTNKGLIWATDRLAWRLDKLKRRAARAKVFNYRTALWLEEQKLPTKTKFDGVLVDAPCSGVGTWQRNPHARWTTTPNDVRELATLQGQLLRRVADSVKPGGRLVYSVCTLTRAETVEVADRFEREMPGFEPSAAVHPLRPEHTPSSRIFLWPQEFGGNGMFVAVWRRVA